jgi:hypothetical protein
VVSLQWSVVSDQFVVLNDRAQWSNLVLSDQILVISDQYSVISL